MCEAGPHPASLEKPHQQPGRPHPVVGYCAYNTLGSVIRAGIDPVYIFGEPHKVKAKIESFDGFSATPTKASWPTT